MKHIARIEKPTPDDFDKDGRKVSFVEDGRPYRLGRISAPFRIRLSDPPKEKDNAPAD
jgi:hypothetical protein